MWGRGGGGAGGTLTFACYRGSDYFFGFNILNFAIFGCRASVNDFYGQVFFGYVIFHFFFFCIILKILIFILVLIYKAQ